MAQTYAAKYLAKAAMSAPRDLVRAAVGKHIALHPSVFIFHCTFVCDARCEMCSNWQRGDRKTDMTLEQVTKAFQNPLAMGGAPMAGAPAAGGRDDAREHKTASYLEEDDNVFGLDRKAAPPVIGQ